MADFRKWFLAFAVVALLSGLASTASAQTSAFACTAASGNPPLVRSEGETETVGDLVILCTGGVPTALGAQIQTTNIEIFMNTNVTSRLYHPGTLSEALLTIDEPFPLDQDPNPPTATQPPNSGGHQLLCLPGTVCPMFGNGTGAGVYDGLTPTHYNVWQGSWQGAPTNNFPNGVLWAGIPIDPPGTSGTRTIRITNVRVNASAIFIPAGGIGPINMTITATGSQALPINNAQQVQTVAFATPGLADHTIDPVTFTQCVTDPDGHVFIHLKEAFPSSFKRRTVDFPLDEDSTPDVSAVPAFQNILGHAYQTESDFYQPDLHVQGLATSVGLADHGNRFIIRLANVSSAISGLSLPLVVSLDGGLIDPDNATKVDENYLRLVNTDPNGAGAFSAAASGDLTPVGGFAQGVYEVMASDPTAIETATIDLTVSYTASLTVPPVNGTVSVWWAPISTDILASYVDPIPRFLDNNQPSNAINIIACTCDILFPFVANTDQYETGIAIANTTQDPYGTTEQQGTVTLNYYSGGAPVLPQTSAVVPPGTELTFTLGGGNPAMNIDNRAAGFVGYIIAQTKFQFCHAFAYISDHTGLQVAEGYLGIILDPPGLYRDLPEGENLGN